MNLNGGDEIKRYIIESSGSGVAFLDYDGDGLTDIFLVNGTRLSGLPPGPPPTNHLYRNQGNLKFHGERRTVQYWLGSGSLQWRL